MRRFGQISKEFRHVLVNYKPNLWFKVHEFGSLSAPLPVHEESLHKQSEHEPEPLLAKPTDLYGDSSDQVSVASDNLKSGVK